MRSTRRASSARRWPSAARARAVASPMPEEAPVMTATRALFGSRLMVISYVAGYRSELGSSEQKVGRRERYAEADRSANDRHLDRVTETKAHFKPHAHEPPRG